ncbi:MAG: hypothetical protein IGS50_11425 [Synechococcales cyanobacterium C42_A2020_086]|nr:hypothetical protein [Synechococcales cyanobacterium C42_A2020_086]
MTQDVRQWLTEIKNLQQQLAVAQQEREQAYTAAANWRTLYETEARQRRGEAEQARETIAQLQKQLQNRQPTLAEVSELASELPEFPQLADDVQAAYQKRLQQYSGEENLRQQLWQAWFQIDQLTQALAAEQAAHVQTRHDLTTALGDAMRIITKERTGSSSTQSHLDIPTGKPLESTEDTPAVQAVGQTQVDTAKTPSLQLPQLDLAQSQS